MLGLLRSLLSVDVSALSQTEFLEFPSGEDILRLLRGSEESLDELDPLYAKIAERLGGRTYERSAAAFLLIETIYDYEDVVNSELSYLLPRCVFVLTADRDLALSALSAYNEIKDAFKFQGPVVIEDEAAKSENVEGSPEEKLQEVAVEVESPSDDDDTVPIPTTQLADADVEDEADHLLEELQGAQKLLVDCGLSARISLDLTARRPTPERKTRVQSDLTELREALRRFENLIEGAEAEVLGPVED